MPTFRYELGCEAEDIVSGLRGFITARCEYITGCMQYLLNPRETKDGQPVTATWFDEDRLKVNAQNTPLVMMNRDVQDDKEDKPRAARTPQGRMAPIGGPQADTPPTK